MRGACAAAVDAGWLAMGPAGRMRPARATHLVPAMDQDVAMTATPPPSQPSQPSQPGQPGPPVGWIDLTIQGSVLTSNMIVPSVKLNGHPMPSRYGHNVYPVPPGPWRIELSAQWLKTYGQASLDVQVAEGQTVPVFYAAPLHQFARGNIGFEKQKRPGMKGMVLTFLVILLIVVFVPALIGLLA